MCVHIVWSLLALQHLTPTLVTLPASLTSSHWLLEHASINLATLTTLIYVVTYLIMDPLAGGKDILSNDNILICFKLLSLLVCCGGT